jgi:hypothetical protein
MKEQLTKEQIDKICSQEIGVGGYSIIDKKIQEVQKEHLIDKGHLYTTLYRILEVNGKFYPQKREKRWILPDKWIKIVVFKDSEPHLYNNLNYGLNSIKEAENTIEKYIEYYKNTTQIIHQYSPKNAE